MSQRVDKSLQAQNEARSNQHISSIAHLFFDSSGDCDSSSSQATERHLLVVGTGRDTCAPYTAAGLGHHILDQSNKLNGRGSTGAAFPMRQVFFGEPSPVCFSALSHLKESTYRLPLAEEVVPWERNKVANGPIFRLFPGTVPSEDFSGGLVEGTFYIRHFDLPREAELQALETHQLSGQHSSLSNDGTDALLWCVGASAAASLVLTGRLGRLLRVVRPRKVYLLVFDGPGQGKNNPHQKHSPQTESLVLDKSKRLLKYVAGEIEVDSRLMAVSGEERAFQLSSLARQLSLS